MRKSYKKIKNAVIASLVLLCSVSLLYNVSLPDSFLQCTNDKFSFHGNKDISVMKENENGRVCLGLFGVIPVKTVDVNTTERPYLIPCGTPFGVKLLAEGVVVTDFGTVSDYSPAEKAGIKTGDIITSINGKEIKSSQEFSAYIQDISKNAELTVIRDGKELTFSVIPDKTANGVLRLGIWVRDSCAGIGTMTFYDAQNGTFSGLGHAICDTDTGVEMPLGEGVIVPVAISDAIKGYAGRPGELIGSFMSDVSIGNIELNTRCGIFGKAAFEMSDKTALPMAFRQEIQPGKATILTTTMGTEPKEYEIIIEKINYNEKTISKNMTIKITDTELLAETGGIIQGMSGSPIIQNGRIVGAVTHVLINDPTRGYGVFAENMYTTACSELSSAA